MTRKEKFGKLVLLEEIDADYLGVTYLAARLGPAGLDRIVTLLRYAEAISAHPEAPSRLAQQSRLASRLRIPGLVRVLGIGRVERSYYASFELMEGRTLRAVIDRARRDRFPFTADNALMVASRAAAALSALHERKDDAGVPLFHGLVRPSHLVVTWEGDVRMMGLGLWAGLRDTGLLDEDERRYLAPEQLGGAAGDARSDVYALALVLLEMLTGGAPEGGDPLGALAGARHTTAAGEQESLPGPIVDVLRRSLAPEPSSRHATIEEMKTGIDTLLFSGDFTPTTFNLAFFMHTLFREDMEREAAILAEASQADYSDFLPRPAVATAAAETVTPDESGTEGDTTAEPPTVQAEAAASAEPGNAATAAAPAETAARSSTSDAAEAATEPDVGAPPAAPVGSESRARKDAHGSTASGDGATDPSGSGRRARTAGGRGSRTREGTLKLARASGPEHGRRGLMLLAGIVSAVAVGGGLGHFVLARRDPAPATAPTTVSPDVAAALARVRELETRLAELEQEKAEMEARAEGRAEPGASPSSPAPSADAEAAARARAEARQRARAERARREAEIRRLETELRTAEERLVEEQRVAQSASALDLVATLPTLAAPPPTPEPVPPPTTQTAVRPGDLADMEDPSVTLPVFLSEQSTRYPTAAWTLRREGSVVVEALVDERGAVRDAKVIESTATGVGFEEAALRQVQSRRYRPAEKSGVPVRVWIRIRVNFTL